MLKIVTTILCVYMLVRCVLPLRCKRPLKMLLALLVLLVGFRLHIFSLLYATFNPELPRWVLVSTGVPHVLFFLLALLSLLRDGVCLIWWLARRLRPGLPALPGSNRQMTALLLVALVMTVMAVPAALRIPDVRTQEIVLPGLPPALDGLRVAQLTDLHISRNFPAEWTRAVVDRTNALRPDIILLTGDLMDGSPALRREDFAPMADLRAPLGVFACPGNHEYYSDLPAWRPVLRAHGITLLENEAAVLPVRGSHLTVAGVTDNVAGRFGLPGPDPHRALEGTPRPRILMAHKPELFHETAPEIDLQLSGHTHGGLALLLDQGVALFNGGFVRGWTTPACMWAPAAACGAVFPCAWACLPRSCCWSCARRDDASPSRSPSARLFSAPAGRTSPGASGLHPASLLPAAPAGPTLAG